MGRRQILLVEDDAIAQTLVNNALKDTCGLRVVGDARSAMEYLRSSAVDLILLDVQLPDKDGFSLYTEIRHLEPHEFTPIIFLTGQGDLDRRLQGFALGADDYIVKPFHAVEFQAKIASKLRNLDRLHAEIADLPDSLLIGPFHVLPGVQKVSVRDERGETTLDLTANQFKVLFYFLRHPDEIISRQSLLKGIWGDGVNVTDRTIDTHIYAIRKKLGPLAELLQSVHRQGYRLNLTFPSVHQD